ncbi:hypothetical protein SETIT_2G049600v2 [Setaria italica]|uniref:Uncharacterized protein n=1 Tax=Setaria italica TaxID=4555 RepID=A0A368PXH9_SETIT|nr:hypothetical protein SETIT_2G049600v2 [Setaria italica]
MAPVCASALVVGVGQRLPRSLQYLHDGDRRGRLPATVPNSNTTTSPSARTAQAQWSHEKWHGEHGAVESRWGQRVVFSRASATVACSRGTPCQQKWQRIRPRFVCRADVQHNIVFSRRDQGEGNHQHVRFSYCCGCCCCF